MELPNSSPKISQYCIDLIKRCREFKASERPTFDEIINDMLARNFALASEIDVKVIKRRFYELNSIISQQKKSKK